MGNERSRETAKWRRGEEIEWEKHEDVRNEITMKSKSEYSGQKPLKVLVFGPTGSGKSSFCNGVKTALTGSNDVSQFFVAGGAGGTLTQGFQQWVFENIHLVDMAGVMEEEEIFDDNMRKIFQGKIPTKAKLDKKFVASEEIPDEQENMYYCVVLVLKPGDQFSSTMKRIAKILKETIGMGNMAYHLVLTHLDAIDRKYHDPKNLQDILTSDVVQQSVLKMEEETGIPRNCISFVRNYSGETRSVGNCNALFLDTFRRIVNSATEQAEKRGMQDQ